jgi:hypothetical protein
LRPSASNQPSRSVKILNARGHVASK